MVALQTTALGETIQRGGCVRIERGGVFEGLPGLADHPELVNQDPFGKGWMAKIKADSLDSLESLMDAAKYVQSIA